jgi:hypothetical protein
MATIGYFFGLFFGVMCKDSNKAIQLLPMAMIPMLLFGGLVVNLETIPDYIKWFQYFSPIRHSYSILMLDQLSSSRFNNLAQFK